MKKITIKTAKFLTTVSLCCLLSGAPVWAAVIDNAAQAMRLATEQRILTQKLLKNYVLSGLGVRSRKADQAIQDAIGQFEANNTALLSYVTDNATRTQLTQLVQHWQQTRPKYQVKPDKSQLLNLFSLNEQLLQQSEQLVLSLQQSDGSKTGPMLDLAGQQGMLSVRLVALYGMMAWGYEAQAKAGYQAVYTRFSEASEMLRKVPDNTALINHNLKDLQRQLQRIRTTAESSSDTYIPGLIDRSVVKMLKKVSELQDEYQVLARTLDD